MKLCPNPDCLAHQQHRTFFDTDVVCPRCGEVLVNPNLAGTGTVPADTYAAYAATTPMALAAPRQALSAELALMGAAGTLLLAFLIVAMLIALNIIHRGGVPGPIEAGGGAPTLVVPAGTVTGGTTTPVVPQTPLPAAQASATAHAVATFLAQPTPVGGFLVSPTPAPGDFNVAGLPTLPPPLGQGGNTGGSLPAPTAGTASNVVTPRLCGKISAGALCTDVTTYGSRDMFNIAVQATFGAGAAQSLRVRLYGPPNGETALLNQDQTNTPGRTGTFWVGFAFTQNQPWPPGIYRADIFVNNDSNRVAFVTWTVVP